MTYILMLLITYTPPDRAGVGTTTMVVPGFKNKEACIEAGYKHTEVVKQRPGIGYSYSCVPTEIKK